MDGQANHLYRGQSALAQCLIIILIGMLTLAIGVAIGSTSNKPLCANHVSVPSNKLTILPTPGNALDGRRLSEHPVTLYIPLPDIASIAATTRTWRSYSDNYVRFQYPPAWETKQLGTKYAPDGTREIIGLRPHSMLNDVEAEIEVTSSSLSASIDRSQEPIGYIVDNGSDRYSFIGDFANEDILRMIYATFRATGTVGSQ